MPPDYLKPNAIVGVDLYAYGLNNPIMYVDPTGHFVLLTLAMVAISVYGATKAYDTATDLGYSGTDLAGYTLSGLAVGDYLVVKDNWETISQTIEEGYDSKSKAFNFSFTENPYYSMYTASLFTEHLCRENEAMGNPVKGRTKLGIYIELQAHYVAYKIGIPNGNPAWLGEPSWSGDWTAALCETAASILSFIGTFIGSLF